MGARATLLRLRQEIAALADHEYAAVDDGLAALERLCTNLADVPTPAGPAPGQLRNGSRPELPVLPFAEPNHDGATPGPCLEAAATQW